MPRSYFSLLPKFPKSAGTCKEFRDWDIELRAKYPTRYKINAFLETAQRKLFLYPSWRLRDAKYWVLHRIHPKYIYHKITLKTLKPGYHDTSELILHTSFDLFTEFMEFQLSDDCHILWDYSEEVPDENVSEAYILERQERWVTMNELYEWWTKVRPNREDTQEDFPDLPDDWGFMAPLNEDFDDTPEVKEWRRVADEHNRQEEEWNREDETMLIRLMKIRLSLWD